MNLLLVSKLSPIRCMEVNAYSAPGSYSDHTLVNSSRWWGPNMLESSVRKAKLSIITAMNKFSICKANEGTI